MTIDTTERLRLSQCEDPSSGWVFCHVSHNTVGNVRAMYPPEGPWNEEQAFAAMQGYNAQKGVVMGEPGAIAWDPPRHSTKGTELLFNDFGSIGNWPFVGEE